jgi:membrane-bound lytic murein transglycosylase D
MGVGGHLLRRKALALWLLILLPAPIPTPAQPLPARHTRSSPPLYGLQPPDSPVAREAIEAWIQRILSSESEALQCALQRARPFREHICSRLAEQELPPELLYLPILESGYQVRAVSRSGAAGLWQLMTNTASPLGLRRDRWVDQRLDFWTSTEAALRKLEEGFQRFGSWELALAAYNCGMGALQRAIASSGLRDFWGLREKGLLPRETAEYVPRFYALMILCSYPQRHALPLQWQPGQSWTRLLLPHSVELALLAEAAGLDLELLSRGNAELRTPLTPPDASGYWLKVPAEALERLQAVLADENAVLLKYGYHTLRSGDTFYGLARYYGVDMELLRQANPGADPRRLRIGELLRIPVLGGAPLRSEPGPAAPQGEFDGRYTVLRGDTLWSISRSYGTTPEALAAGNGRSLDGILKPGETLKVPAAAVPERREGVSQ